MIMVYQLKVGLCLIAFYLVWKLLLSRETLHRFNRVLLLSVTALAFLLPWVKLTLNQPTVVSEGMIDIEGLFVMAVDDAEPSQGASWSWIGFAYIIYIVGVVVMLLWNGCNSWRLLHLLRRSSTQRLPGGELLHVVKDDVSPFSYFHHIVVSEQDMHDAAGEILTHEQAHIWLRHSFDVLFMDVVLLFQWWNPAAWLLRRELKQVHEYEADEAVLKRGVDAQQYQLLLIRKSVGDQLFSMANNLNYQSLKKRIRMMTTKKSSRWQQLRALAVVPVAALALVAFAQPEVKNVEEQVEQAVSTPQPQMATPDGSWKAQTLPLDPQTLQKTDTTKVFDVVEQMPEFPGGTQELMQFLYSNIKYPKDAMEADMQGRVLVTFVVNADGQVVEPQVVKGVCPSLDAEALRVVGLMPKWKPGMQKGQAVRVKYTIPISFRLQGEKEKAIYFIKNAESMGAEPLLVVDGKEVTKAVLEALDQEKIDAITVLRGVAGEKVYGAKGKNGVIEVKLKK